MRILLAAEEAAGTQVLRMLATGEDELVCVFTSGAGQGGLSSVAGLAESLGVPVAPAETVKADAALRDFGQIDLFLNVHSLFKIHPGWTRLPRIGAFNLHPGPLPRYSGLNAPSWALYRGEAEHAVTLHWVEAGIDTGPIAYASAFPIREMDTGLTISSRCVREGIPLIARLIDVARRSPERIPRRPQAAEGRQVFYRRQVPNKGAIDWARPADEIARLVRASDFYPLTSPWGPAWTMLGRTRIEVQKARPVACPTTAAPGAVIAVDAGGAHVSTGAGTLIIEKILQAGRAIPPSHHLPAGSILSHPMSEELTVGR
ncbi:MAG: formyltransferase family protein [Pseudomonadota bacterium]